MLEVAVHLIFIISEASLSSFYFIFQFILATLFGQIYEALDKVSCFPFVNISHLIFDSPKSPVNKLKGDCTHTVTSGRTYNIQLRKPVCRLTASRWHLPNCKL